MVANLATGALGCTAGRFDDKGGSRPFSSDPPSLHGGINIDNAIMLVDVKDINGHSHEMCMHIVAFSDQ